MDLFRRNSPDIGFGLRYPSRNTQRRIYGWLFIITYLLQGALFSATLVRLSKDSTKWVVNLLFDLAIVSYFGAYCNSFHVQSVSEYPHFILFYLMLQGEERKGKERRWGEMKSSNKRISCLNLFIIFLVVHRFAAYCVVMHFILFRTFLSISNILLLLDRHYITFTHPFFAFFLSFMSYQIISYLLVSFFFFFFLFSSLFVLTRLTAPLDFVSILKEATLYFPPEKL